MIPDAIAISPTACIATRIEGARSCFEASDHEVMWQERIETTLKAIEIRYLLALERGNLSEGMHSSVGPTSHADTHWFIEKPPEHCFKRTLERHGVLL